LTTLALPSGISATKTTWTVGGTNIGDYLASADSASVSDTIIDQPDITFYWVYPKKGLIPVKYKYCLTIPGAGYQCSKEAEATFEVTGPGSGDMKATAYRHVRVVDLGGCTINSNTYPAEPWLVYGGSVTGDCLQTYGIPGIKFKPPTGFPNGSNGLFTVIQVVNSNITSGYQGGLWSDVLDGNLPYGTFPAAISDSPMTPLLPTYSDVSRTMTATDFLMWQPPPPSIEVPLGYMQWQYSGSATCSSSCDKSANWTAITNGVPGVIKQFTPSKASTPSVGNIPLKYGYPIWVGNTDN
jgi:hypothetical protein